SFTVATICSTCSGAKRGCARQSADRSELLAPRSCTCVPTSARYCRHASLQPPTAWHSCGLRQSRTTPGIAHAFVDVLPPRIAGASPPPSVPILPDLVVPSCPPLCSIQPYKEGFSRTVHVSQNYDSESIFTLGSCENPS